jgi:hypothetical protein
MTETSTTTENRQGVLAIGLLALAEHIAQHQLPFPMDIYSPAGLDAPYLRIRVSGAGDQMRWLNTVHVDGETSEPLDTGDALRLTWHVRLPDTGTRVELVGLRQADALHLVSGTAS